ncbi:MAG: hypothetical protein BA863_01355 [Desulfovibrio sp. S3730MH75]|nr:MAG: hypothetical protein BA863_01355 [Desulfovibrio sp. S3730MH75]
MIGPLPPPIGGTRVLFKNLLDTVCQRADVHVTVVENRPVRSQKIQYVFIALPQIVRLVFQATKADVVTLHVGMKSIHVRGAFVSFIARMIGKPLIIHTFGSVLYRQEYGELRSRIIRRCLQNAFLYLAETKALVAHAKEDTVGSVEWFPNARPLPQINCDVKVQAGCCRRFVFVSHIKRTKGIRELITAAERFGEDVIVDVYGPFRDDITASDFETCLRVNYRGELSPDDVLPTLCRYDALLLPSYHPTEGYPGIIIEAYMVGMPVICTRWRQLPEIVDDTSGLLVEPRDADDLYKAMKRLNEDEELFERLQDGALAKRKDLDIAVWGDRFIDFCREAFISQGQK